MRRELTGGKARPPYRLLARSRTAFTQPDRVALALAAARSYRALRASLTRIVRYSLSPSSTVGLPLPRFGASIGLIMYQQITLDNGYLLLVH